MPYSFNPFTSNFDKVEQPPIGFGDVFHLNPLTADQLVVGDGTDFIKILPAGAEGQILRMVSGIPAWSPDSSGITYNVDATQTIATAVNNAYITTNALTVTATLPATAAVGDVVCFKQFGAGKIVVAQNAGQTIHTVSASSTTGAGGSLETIDQYSSFCLVCVAEDTDWMLESGSHGGFTIT